MSVIRAFSWASCAALLVLTACTTPADGGEQAANTQRRQCFWAQNVNGFNAIDQETVTVTVGVNDVYRLDLMGRCPDIDWNQSIGLVSRGGSSICSGLDATIVTRGPGGMTQRCPVRMVTRLTAEEATALRARPRGN